MGLCVLQRRLFILQTEAQERERKLADDYRQREAELLNRILRLANVQPVGPRVEVENVVKLPDPEIAPPDWIDQTLRLDEIKEFVEERHPDLSALSVSEIRDRYPQIWHKCEQLRDEYYTPLRAL